MFNVLVSSTFLRNEIYKCFEKSNAIFKFKFEKEMASEKIYSMRRLCGKVVFIVLEQKVEIDFNFP